MSRTGLEQTSNLVAGRLVDRLRGGGVTKNVQGGQRAHSSLTTSKSPGPGRKQLVFRDAASVVVAKETLAGLASQPSRPGQSAQDRRGPVALLAALQRKGVERRQHVVEADLVGPGEDPPRIVEAVDHAD